MTDRRGHIDPALLARLFNGSLTQENRDQLRSAAARDPELASEIRHIERLGELVPEAEPYEANPPSRDEINAAWERIAERTGIRSIDIAGPSERAASEDRPAGRGSSFRLYRLPARWVVAASVLLVLIAGYLLMRPNDTPDMRSVTTLRGQTATLSLADGTDVMLNADSRIRYDVDDPSGVRRVILEGEARFIVNPDERPFVVETPQASVRVLGTRFTVRSREETTRVAVQEGRVAVSSDSVHVELSGQEAVDVLSNTRFIRLGTDVAGTADDWTEGTMSFSRTPLTEVLLEIERRYDIAVRLDGQWQGTETLTGSFPGLDAPDILESVCRTFDCEVRKSESGFVLAR